MEGEDRDTAGSGRPSCERDVVRESERDMDDGAPFCRICHERSDELIQPCDCRGTVRNVHAECIQMWLSHRRPDEMRCELCGYQFRLKVKTQSLFWFMFSADGWKHWVHMAYIIFIGRRIWVQMQTISSVIPKASRSRSWKFFWRLFLHCFMLVHYTLFFVFDAQYLLRKWLRWRHLTSEVVVYGKP